LDIALAFDEDYADPARVTVESILCAHERSADLNLWLLTPPEVAHTHGPAFQRQVAGRARVHLLEASDSFRRLPRSACHDLGYISNGMYLRLFLPAVVPASVRRLLYLDVDTMCLGDLRPLWDVDLGGHPLAAVVDGSTKTCDAIPGANGRRDPDAPYFNSGVLLIDTARWRELRVSERCFDYVWRHREQLRFPDQDALNLVIGGQWLRLGTQWNFMRSWRAEFGHAGIDWAAKGRIVHFSGINKPWDDMVHTRTDRYAVLARRVHRVRRMQAACASS
jgi:lipopolysaccharide biosynthesis glycosyltransferase